MKKIFTFLLLFTTAMMVNAQQNLTKDETAVNAAVEKLRAAMVSGNKADLESLLSNDLSYSHSNGHVETRADFIKAISTKKSDFVKIDLVQQSVTVIDQIGIARHILVADTNDGGVPKHIFLGIVQIWRNEKGTWRMVGRRAFHVPAEDVAGH